MTWANNGLPTYIAVSGSKAARLPEAGGSVQVGDTLKTAACGIKYGFQRHGVVFNRTLVDTVYIFLVVARSGILKHDAP